MSNILSVRVTSGNRLLQFRSEPYVVSQGDHVLVQVQGELHMGKVERITPLVGSEDGPERLAPEDVEARENLSDQNDEVGGEVEADVESASEGVSDTAADSILGGASDKEAECDRVAGSTENSGMPSIFRPATEEDLIRDRENRELARNAFAYCRECIGERGLDMKLVDVEVLFDGSKMVFYFTAPNRIDFRELVKDLVRSYRTRIELRQIGARHETQMLGGLGNCGQLVCCQRFLRQFAPSTIKMAKEQNLFLNPAKISGVCNRLLCCLSYEQPNYDEFLNQCPKVGKRFPTSLGTAKVIRANYFRRTVSVFMEPGGEREVDLEEWKRLISPPRERGEPERRESGPRTERPEGAGVEPPRVVSRPVAASEPVTADATAHQVEAPQASPEVNRPSPGPSRKKNKRSGRKGKSRPDASRPSDSKPAKKEPAVADSPKGETIPATPGKSKRRSRSSRRKPKKQSGPPKEQS
ncbi:regulatory iron-sulfur-containing complex subunit RicT [Desulfonatronum thiodismutans]|uniref:regulatory iron-sulfur-containing complex subunit RicT n=1 Tax=Desulfonatronum thiodismutans TaxID=159290 RepID=UPI000550B329|nr:regulatory iron-sulfur-containing complex subunit RicT [Desulfonatronum thiodismutans]